MAYERVAGPLGYERGDWQAASVASGVANIFVDKNSSVSPKDFVLRWDHKPETQSWEEQLAALKAAHVSVTKADRWRTRKGGADVSHRNPSGETGS